VAEAIQARQVRIADEPHEAGRVRRWPDLIRLLFEVLMIVVVVTLGKFGVHTTSGVETDVHDGVELAPSFLLGGITVLMNITTAVIPIGLAVERLLLRDGRRVADAVIAAVLTCGTTALLNVWITSAYAPRWLLAELTHRLAAGATTPLHVYIATVVAFLTVVGFNDRPTLRSFTWVCVGIYATAALVSGGSALVGLIVSFLIGRAIAFGWRYTRGVVNNRSTGGAVVAALTRAGLEPVSCRWLGDHGDVRHYEVLCADGRCLEATLLDRDRQGIGAIYRLYRRTRLRGPAQRRNLLSVHRTVEHEALMSYSLADAGINTPKLVAVRELSADAALVAFERVHACALKQIPKEKFTDALLERVFTTVRELGDHQIAHRRLALDSILIDEHGQIWLTELRDGEVAADDLQHLLDIAGTMAALALKAGPERTVRVGVQVLGEDLVSAALPLLQPVALTGTTRAALGKSKQLIERLREEISELRPNAPVGEPVRLERLKIRTFLAVTAGCVAVYLLMLEISSADSQSKRSLGS
jgi:tRNA A-37 threonylcarbamoyl transferase component Bud32